MRGSPDEAVPDIEDGLDLIRDDAVGLAQRGNVGVGEEQRCLERREIVLGERRLGQRLVAEPVTWNGAGGHGVSALGLVKLVASGYHLLAA